MPNRDRDPRPYLRERGASEAAITKATAELDQAKAWVSSAAPFALRAYAAAQKEDWKVVEHLELHIEELQTTLTPEAAHHVIELLLAQCAELTHTIHDHAPDTFAAIIRGEI